MRITVTLLCLTAAAGATAAADLPYAGTWKYNAAKSNPAGTTMTFQKLANGEWQSSADGATYKFKLDGAEYPDGLGETAAWKSIDANTWETVWKTNGHIVSTDTMHLGSDGMLTVESKGTRPNGAAFDDKTVYQRVSGPGGLEGKWRSKNVQMSTATVIEFRPAGANKLTFRNSDQNLTCDAQLDGKDYTCTGPNLTPGWTISLKESGARTLEMVVKKDGKPFYHYTDVVSADGKTLETTSWATATNEKTKMVFDKQ
jgi:hypothetical protein